MKKILEKFADIKIKVYLCNMYKLILILLFSLWGYSYGQQLIINPFQQKMDSIAFSKLNLTITQTTRPERLISYNPLHKVRITIKTGFNKNAFNNIISKDSLTGKEITINELMGNFFDGLQADDYANFLRYSIRGKVYINRRFRWVCSFVGIGVSDGWMMSSGIIYKY